ncbi:helix-turn-helix domain-containing protein [uncultured Microbulbifer sp.]|uniref:helix-turn-helix domain-containing protein n=1 Tax=uncultured Microbulbifer sp. TaxID=348147 RepID=UPI00260FBB8B|nr:helix-turn-helix domain-containing protein [uncultured Microbulbifer sp.]
MATHPHINFAFMQKQTKRPKDKGKDFERLARAAGFRWAQIARELDVQPQTITHWRKRGVSAVFALRVADLLNCKPTEISAISQSVVEVVSPEQRMTPSQKQAQQAHIAEEPASYDITHPLPNHVRQLITLIEKRALDGSLTKAHTTVLKNSLELMTGHEK